jgi:hypothetical protein
MAGRKRDDRSPAHRRAAPVPVEAEPEGEIPLPARVHRSRLAFAVSVTVAALPVLVFDNFPATADTGERPPVEASAPGDDPDTGEASTASSRDVAPVAAPAPTEAPATTAVAAPSEDDGDDAAGQESTAAPQSSTATAPATSSPPTTRPPAPATTAAPQPSSPGDPSDPATWDRLAECESFGQWDMNTGNGYYGGLQFSLASWQEVGGAGYPHEASREEQIKRGQALQARYGWDAWPHCSAELGYR